MSSVTERLVDDALVARAAKGDADAFGRLYDRHVQRVYAHCAYQIGSLQDAEDLTAVVFFEAWRHRDRVRVVSGSALPWLLVTATNVARNHLRAARRYRAALRKIPPPPASPDHSDRVVADAAFAQTGRALAEALSGLGKLDRQVVSLCLIGGLTYAEAGQVLGISHAAVRSRLMRSRRTMKTALLQAGIGSAEKGIT